MGVTKWLKNLFAFAPGDPLVSIVFLLREHRTLTEPAVMLAANRAWGEGTYTVEWPRLRRGGREWIMQSMVGMFTEDLQSKAKTGEDTKAVRAHRGWWSIDLQSGAADAEAYQQMGVLMAALLNANCLAVYYPQSEGLYAVDSETGIRMLDGLR